VFEPAVRSEVSSAGPAVTTIQNHALAIPLFRRPIKLSLSARAARLRFGLMLAPTPAKINALASVTPGKKGHSSLGFGGYLASGCGAALRSLPRAHAVHEPPHEALALLDLLDRNELVGLVRLLDRAGSAHDGRDTRRLELRAFGAERHLAEIVVA